MNKPKISRGNTNTNSLRVKERCKRGLLFWKLTRDVGVDMRSTKYLKKEMVRSFSSHIDNIYIIIMRRYHKKKKTQTSKT